MSKNLPGVWKARIDRWVLRFDQEGSEVEETTGYVRVWGQAGKVGTLVYGEADGAPRDGWTEFVPPETLFEQASLDTLINAPLTLQHPPEFLDTSNTDRFQIGSVIALAPLPDAGTLRVRVLITNAAAIKAVRSGEEVELSLGYTALVGGDPGEFEGEAFDAVQLQRRYNHLAIVTEARAGPDNALDRVDAHLRLAPLFRADGLRIQLRTGAKQVSKQALKKVDATLQIGDQEFTVDQEVADAFAGLEDQLADATKDEKPEDAADEEGADAKDAEGDEEEKEGEEDSKNDSHPVTLGDVKRLVADGVQQTVAALGEVTAKGKRDAARLGTVIAQAKAMLGASYNTDGKSPERIMADAVTQSVPKLKADMAAAVKSKDAGRVQGIFDAARVLRGDSADRTRPTEVEGEKKEASRHDKAIARRADRTLRSRKPAVIKNGRPVAFSKSAEGSN